MWQTAEDPDGMSQDADFHQGKGYLPRQERYSEKEIYTLFVKNNLQRKKMCHHKFVVSNQKE